MSLSVATIRPPVAIYREEQYFAWWLYALLAAMVVVGWTAATLPHAPALPVPGVGMRSLLNLPFPLLVGLVLPPMMVVGVLRMTTEVTADVCRVWFGMIPTFRRGIALSTIQRVEIVRYRALRDHGFWGVRTTRDGEKVYTARGNRAVRVHLRDGGTVLIGSQHPDDLAAALEQVMRPAV